MSNFKEYGRISSDIDVSYVGAKNTALAKFSFCVTRNGMKDADGHYITDFHNCQAWGSRAEFLEKYAKKGDRVVVEGNLYNNNYEDKSGVKHYGYVINCSEVKLVENKKDREQQNGKKTTKKAEEPQETTHNRPSANTAADDDYMDVPDDDLPFFG